MTSTDELVEEDSLEKGLLTGSARNEYSEAADETVLYDASFEDLEDNYVKYQTAQWVLYSLLLILAWGIGLLMLLYLPVRRYILRKDFRSRKLYVTPDAVVYKVRSIDCLSIRSDQQFICLLKNEIITLLSVVLCFSSVRYMLRIVLCSSLKLKSRNTGACMLILV